MKQLEIKKNGYVLVTVLVIMSVLLVITYFLADALYSELAIARNQKAATAAFHLSESGVQEAVWRIQNDDDARTTFLTTETGETTFDHDDPALLAGGSYSVTIKNTSKGAADITSIGLFKIGLKTAQRKIQVNVTKAITPPPYDLDGAIFTGGSTGEEDITLTAVEANITGDGSLISNRDIWFTLSNINVAKDILAKRNIRNVLSTVTAGGVVRENDPGTYTMPAINVTADCLLPPNPLEPESYKCLAQQSPNHYYTAQEFKTLLQHETNLTLDGIVYVAGNQGINIDWWQSLTVNGLLVAEGSIDVGGPLRRGTLTINHVEGQPSGMVTLSKLTAWAYSRINITGVVYVGDRFSFDPWFNLDPSSRDINIVGGVLCRRFEGRGIRTINIQFNKDLINEALRPNPGSETPIIQFQHWEEEY